MLDYHVHSISPDTNIPMEEMCQAAIEKNIEEIIFTDHYELYSNGVTRPSFCEEYLQSYIATLKKCRKEYKNRIEVKSGIELGQYHLDESRGRYIIKQQDIDYINGSIHKIDNVDLSQLVYTENTTRQITKKYFEQLLCMVKTGDYDCIGHFDLYKRHAPNKDLLNINEEFESIIKEILERIVDRGKGIEINTSGLRKNAECMPSDFILKKYKQVGGEIITVGSDAHHPNDIGNGIMQGYKLMKQHGFEKVARYDKRKVSYVCLNEMKIRDI